MAFEFLGYQFDGAYISADYLESSQGVYVIWCRCENEWTVLDVGESDNVREQIKNHERKSCWEKHCPCEIYYSATYTRNLSQSKRTDIKQEIRNKTDPPCGGS